MSEYLFWFWIKWSQLVKDRRVQFWDFTLDQSTLHHCTESKNKFTRSERMMWEGEYRWNWKKRCRLASALSQVWPAGASWKNPIDTQKTNWDLFLLLHSECACFLQELTPSGEWQPGESITYKITIHWRGQKIPSLQHCEHHTFSHPTPNKSVSSVKKHLSKVSWRQTFSYPIYVTSSLTSTSGDDILKLWRRPSHSDSHTDSGDSLNGEWNSLEKGFKFEGQNIIPSWNMEEM